MRAASAGGPRGRRLYRRWTTRRRPFQCAGAWPTVTATDSGSVSRGRCSTVTATDYTVPRMASNDCPSRFLSNSDRSIAIDRRNLGTRIFDDDDAAGARRCHLEFAIGSAAGGTGPVGAQHWPAASSASSIALVRRCWVQHEPPVGLPRARCCCEHAAELRHRAGLRC